MPKAPIKRPRKDYSSWEPNVVTRNASTSAKDSNPSENQPVIHLSSKTAIRQLNNWLIEEEKEAFSVYKDAKRLASMALISSKIDKDFDQGLIKLPEELEANKVVIKRTKSL
jgi:hypothetical protein